MRKFSVEKEDLETTVGRYVDYHRNEILFGILLLLAFVIIIIAIILGPIAARTKQIQAIKQGQDFGNRIGLAKEFCREKCQRAQTSDCDIVYSAQFCLAYLKVGLNASSNYIEVDNIGYCDDRIYCPGLIECQCQQPLNMKNCINLLCDFWKNQKLEDVNRALGENIIPGSCYYKSAKNHWYNLLGGQASCG